MNTVDIAGVEILRPGKWNGREYTADQLHAMVDAFHDLKDVYAPPGKLGHNKEQALLANDGLPAAGWVKDLRVQDDRLVADFAKVPATLGDLIEAGGYRTRSAEVWFNAEFDGKAYPAVLKAVSWLGADAPAVKGLGDICALYTDGQRPAEVHLAECELATLAISEKDGQPKSPPKGKPTDKSQYADPTNYGYPIDAKHIRAAVSFYNAGKGRSKYTPAEWASMGRKIASAANRLIKPGHSYAGGKIAIKESKDADAKMADYADAVLLFDDGSFSEITDCVRDELQEQYPYVYGVDGMPPSDDDADGPSANIVDLYQDRVIVTDQDCDSLFSIPFTIADDGECTLGEPMRVRRQYTPLPDHAEPDSYDMADQVPTEETDPTMTDAELRAALGIAETADIKTAILSLKAQHVELSDHEAVKTELAELREKDNARETDALIDSAKRDGKLAPTQEEWARTYCLADRSGFEAYLAAAPKVVDLTEHGSEDHETEPPTEAGALAIEVARKMGIDPALLTDNRPLADKMRDARKA